MFTPSQQTVKNPLLLQWNEERVFDRQDDYFDRMLECIAQARTEVLFEVYIFELDPLGTEILGRLRQAADRGVRVALMVDGVGSLLTASAIAAELAGSKVEFRIYHSVLRFWALNHRDHRKQVLFDGTRALIASMNITQVHSERLAKELVWRDRAVEVAGESVLELRKVFCDAFDVGFPIVGKRRFIFRESKLEKQLRRECRQELLLRGYQAKYRIYVLSSYFIPRLSILRVLMHMSKLGLDVRLIAPTLSDVWFERIGGRLFYGMLLRSGVRVFEYLPRILHAKGIIVDDWMTVGSSNLNHRSHLHDLELDIVCAHPESKSKLMQMWEEDLAASRELTLAHWRSDSFWHRLVSRIIIAFRYWL